jgi:hypothetical protein
MADDALREALRDVWDEWLHRAHGITSSCRHDDEIDAVLAVVEARITQVRQDGMNEALDWAARNPGYWAQKVAAHVVAQFESTEEPT